ncbi:MAG: SDR family NAD(P)-dependent oxidoreductase, partial [Pseudomonadota bacterium]
MRALVTGAGHRLGRAMAIYLANRGFDVAVHYASSSGGAEQTVAEIKAAGQNGVALQANLVDANETEALFGRAT